MQQLKIIKQVTNRENSSIDKYINEIGKIKLISAEEENIYDVLLNENASSPDKELLTDSLRKEIERALCLRFLYNPSPD